MRQFIEKINTLSEAFCNFLFAIIVFFSLFVFLSPAFKFLGGCSGFGWIFLTIAVMVIIYLIISFGLDYFFDILDKIRKGEMLSNIRSVNILTSMVGICERH